MRSNEAPPLAVVPHPDTFRPWLQDCLAILGISAANLSRQLGLGRNTIGDFLGKPGRSIDMTTAHAITCKMRDLAMEKREALPRLGGLGHG